MNDKIILYSPGIVFITGGILMFIGILTDNDFIFSFGLAFPFIVIAIVYKRLMKIVKSRRKSHDI